MAYISVDELKSLITTEKMLLRTDDSLTTLIASGKEIIDNYWGREFEEPIPATVKVVNAELVNVMLNDNSKESESNGDYSYKANDKAYEQILKKLNGFNDDPEPVSKSNSIKCMVI